MSRSENCDSVGLRMEWGSETRDDPARVRIERQRHLEELTRRCYRAFRLAGGKWMDGGREDSRRRLRFREEVQGKSEEEADMMIAMLILEGGG